MQEREQAAKAKYASAPGPAAGTASAPAAGAAVAAYPASFDLRDVNGSNYITPIEDQGNCGSCVAFGTTATVEGTFQLQSGKPNSGVDLSEAQLFYCIGGSQGRNCENGWWPDGALAAYQNSGIVDAACFPYTAGDQPCHLCANSQSRLTKITGWHTLSATADMKTWLSTRGSLSTCFSVYDDFYHYTGGVYTQTSTVYQGGHCVCVVGYDDNNRCWICKNSWGTGWGEGGFFQIAYGQCGIDAEMWAVDGVAANMALYRLYHPTTGAHFYTTSAAERDNAVNRLGYQSEGTACYVYGSQATGTTDFYRLYRPASDDHFYTISAAERDNAVAHDGYQSEGTACYVYGSQATGMIALYRLYNPQHGVHFYTTSAAERDNAVAHDGYQSEGTACYVYGA
jgi:C1A family cysteine protease